MVKHLCLRLVLIAAFLGGAAFGGERAFSWTPAPARGDNIAVSLNPYGLGKYLTQCQVNRPEIVNEVKTLLEQGKHYRKRTKDQRGKNVTLTIYVDNDYMLRITTYRDEQCEECKGTGNRFMPFDKVQSHINVAFRCLECDGKGVQKDKTTEKYFVLSSEDFQNPEEGRRILGQRAYSHAPAGAEQWVEKLASQNPQDRLEACLWLDKNYVRNGAFFQDIMPMLKKARYYDSNEKQRIMVWQFWAGRGMQGENRRAYYRIYADTKSGKITKKGFFAGK